MKEEYQYFNRDLSWLSFNYRILMEAADEKVPLYQRIKFIAIYSSNLDEFFRVRVATWRKLSSLKKKKLKPEMTVNPKKLLQKILAEVHQQQQFYGKVLNKSILPLLERSNITLYQDKKLLKSHQRPVRRYFLSKVLSYLQPVILTPQTKGSLLLENGALYFVVVLTGRNNHRTYAQLNIPTAFLPRFFLLPEFRSKHYVMYLDDIIRLNLHYVFPGYRVEGCYAIKLNRDADLELEDEYSGDLITKIKKQVDKRKVGEPTRFLYDEAMPKETVDFLVDCYQLQPEDLMPGGRYHNLNDFMNFPNPVGKTLEEVHLPSLIHADLELEPSILQAIGKKDRMLHFPYQSYDYVLRFFNEAAIDPLVQEIKVTLYRVASDSVIANALISAARNGKKVTAFVEVKARFDEENNLKWADKMEQAGVKLIYSLPGLKVHAKVALVVRKSVNQPKLFAYFGTGNFHEGTARIYCDYGLLTSANELTSELVQVFNYLEERQVEGVFKNLLVAKHNMMDTFKGLIDREIDNAVHKIPAKILIKLNNLENQVMIDKLYQASEAGVQVTILVRGICCLKPDQPYSRNIRVIRLVDVFLEHARVFVFHNAGDDKLFMASADWMNRNLYRRIEVGFPIIDPNIKREILQVLELQMADNVKAYRLDQDQKHQPILNQPGSNRAQTATYQMLKEHH